MSCLDLRPGMAVPSDDNLRGDFLRKFRNRPYEMRRTLDVRETPNEQNKARFYTGTGDTRCLIGTRWLDGVGSDFDVLSGNPSIIGTVFHEGEGYDEVDVFSKQVHPLLCTPKRVVKPLRASVVTPLVVGIGNALPPVRKWTAFLCRRIEKLLEGV
jgi:hypothetical protein